MNERIMTEVERVIQTRSSSSPATSADPNQATQEDIPRLGSRVEAILRAFSREVANQAYQDRERLEWTFPSFLSLPLLVLLSLLFGFLVLWRKLRHNRPVGRVTVSTVGTPSGHRARPRTSESGGGPSCAGVQTRPGY